MVAEGVAGGVTERAIELADVRVAISEAGSGGRPLLLVHGFTGARTDFSGSLARLAARGWHAVAPDLPGHGASGSRAGDGAFSLRRFAADVISLLDALGWDSCALLGHSMGGMIAQEVVATAPARVHALVLMDTSCGPVAVDRELRDVAIGVARTEGMDALADLTATIESPLTTDAYRRLLDEVPGFREAEDRKLRASSPEMYVALAVELTEREPVCERLASVAVPTLVLVGDQDQPFLAPSHTMAATIPGATLAVIADAGHSPQLEAPDAWWEALSGFLDALPEATSPASEPVA
jgi:2-succinyl-6-hydroxy-2,4-cyclohexadiene-1-carboxylate synthase